MQIDWPSVRREMLMHSLFFLPAEPSIALERWLRGRQEFHQGRKADCSIVSFPNSGRTWLKVLLSRFYQIREGYEDDTFIDLDHLSASRSSVPQFHFTHDNYLRDYTRHHASKEAYQNKRVVLLVRDPADVAVSQYHQWRHRMRRRKIEINKYPAEPDLSLFDFVTRRDGALPRILRFMNEWAEDLSSLPSVQLVRYEELVTDTEKCLMNILDFIGTPGSEAQIRRAISFASLENMRKLEDQGNPLMRRGRLAGWRSGDSNRYKARRAKIGGYRGDFTESELAVIDRTIDHELSPIFRYQRELLPVADAAFHKARTRATL